MRLINADDVITAILYDEEHEETYNLKTTIADFLDSHTEEGCPQGNGWISVKDRLPEKSGYYLVFFSDGMPSCKIRVHNWLKDEHHWRGAEAFSRIEGITHWMPLPEPPEEREEYAYIP